MGTGNGTKIQDGLRNPVLVAIVSACLGGGSTGAIYLATPAAQKLARPDPATGTELRELEKEVREHLRAHPDQINRFDARLTALEAQYVIILSNQARILDRLDK